MTDERVEVAEPEQPAEAMVGRGEVETKVEEEILVAERKCRCAIEHHWTCLAPVAGQVRVGTALDAHHQIPMKLDGRRVPGWENHLCVAAEGLIEPVAIIELLGDTVI